MSNNIPKTRTGRFFWNVTAYPRTILAVGLISIFAAAAFLPTLTKETSAEAFIPQDHPAIIYRDKVEEIFGIKDPMVIAVVNEGPHGVFTPQTLGLVSWLTEQVMEVPGVDPERVTSLATEDDIFGTEEGMLVEPFFEAPPTTQEEADRVREAVMDFPLYLGSLVARDGRATLIVAELLNEDEGQAIYESLLSVVDGAPVDGETIHVAGEGAVQGYLGSYIDSDAQRLNPIAWLVITLMLFLAYRTLRGVVLPNLVVLATVATALGMMAAAGVPFYVITNALPVILIGIAVADSIHIMGQYYEELAERPGASQRELVVSSMEKMWRPVTMTTLTTISGFAGIALASYMPPMKAFGLFAALGVAVALVYSLAVLPAGLVLVRPKASRAFQPDRVNHGRSLNRSGRVMAAMGQGVVRRPGVVLTLTAALVLVSVVGALKLEVNEARIENFQRDELIYVADQEINRFLDGTNYLDVVVETLEPEALFRPEHLERIEKLQVFLETLPHVKGTTSIVDYLKQMNRAMHEDQLEAYRLPGDADLVAQYFLLYSASGDPTDFEEEIDYDYQLANVRATLDSGLYTDEKVVVEAVQRYIRHEFNAPGITANLSGRVTVDYHWISRLSDSHFRGVALALFGVWLMATLAFRSGVAGILAVLPVSMTVLLIYAVMGYGGIWLGLGTSMFAAIAIGIGVDFAIHTLDRLVTLVKEEKRTLDEAFAVLFPSTGRALLFNFLAVLFGFGVLTTSQVPPLIRFGSLIGVAVLVSFLASMTVLPALVKLLKPAFLGFERQPSWIPIGREAQERVIE